MLKGDGAYDNGRGDIKASALTKEMVKQYICAWLLAAYCRHRMSKLRE